MIYKEEDGQYWDKSLNSTLKFIPPQNYWTLTSYLFKSSIRTFLVV